MKLATRSLELRDFDRCWAISTLSGQFSIDEVSRLRQAWAYLLPRDEMIGVVVEDFADRAGPRVVAFGASVFASDEWMLRLRKDPKPYEVTRILFDAGTPRSSILNTHEIGKYGANGGLNLVCPHRGELLQNDQADFRASAGILVRVYQDVHRGFHIREMLNEAHGPFETEWCLSGGNWFIRDDFASYYRSSSDPFPAEEQCPYLIGATKAECATNSALWCLFNDTAPVLGFSLRQKRVFLRAIRGRSSKAIASELQISDDAVAACFRSGYDKLLRHPTLREEFLQGDRAVESSKKQRFLMILTNHMEELRPWNGKPLPRLSSGPIFAAAYRGFMS